MTKCIKRAGIVFFVVVLSLLITLGCVLAVSKKDNGSLYDNTASSEIALDNEETYDFELNGNTTQIATQWKAAITAALLPENSGKTIKVNLLSNWIAAKTAEGSTSFGVDDEELAFSNGAILVPENADIELHLNGKVINRNLVTAVANGYVIGVSGKLTITGNAEGLADAKKTFKEVPSLIGKTNNIGKITGGKNTTTGGGVYVGNGGELNVKGGMILENSANNSGGGIYAVFAKVNFYDGIVTDNKTNIFGGGIDCLGCELNIYDGIFANNYAAEHGGGVSSEGRRQTDDSTFVGSFNMYGGSISYNRQLYGGLAIYGIVAEIFGGEITYNQGWGAGSGITIWSGASVQLHGGLVSNNVSEYYAGNVSSIEYCGGGILFGSSSKLVMDGGEISNNAIKGFLEGQMVIGGGIGVYSSASGLMLLGGVIKNNRVEDAGSKVSLAGGVGFKPGINCPFTMGGNIQIYDNMINDQPSDLRLDAGRKITITTPFTQTAHIGIKLAENYGTGTFTTGYGAGNTNPSEFFFSNDGAKLATINGGEVSFENTVESEIYDYIYFENGKRNNYKDNNLTHAVNDYSKSKQVNGGKLILGNITPNTSVNTFIQNINFDRTKVKLYDSNNKLIYDKGNSVTGVDSSLYDKKLELAVGTGWRLETYTASGAKIEEFRLSVLGDSNGDGRISASDVTYIREIANDTELYNNLNAEIKLASLIINKGKVTSADSEIVLNVIAQKLTIDLFY